VVVSVPSAPRRLRAFVTSRGGGDVTRQVRVDLRWLQPAEPGGIISSYRVMMANTLIGDDSWNVSTLAGEPLATKFSLVNAPINTVLYFKVSNNSSAFNICVLLFIYKYNNNNVRIAVVVRILFLFARCRYLTIFCILLLVECQYTSSLAGCDNLKIRHGTKIGNIVTNLWARFNCDQLQNETVLVL